MCSIVDVERSERKGKLETTRSLYSQTPVSRQSDPKKFMVLLIGVKI